jgi:hypothetical protein
MSLDWYGGLASDQISRIASTTTQEAPISEEDENKTIELASFPDISAQASQKSSAEPDQLDDVDFNSGSFQSVVHVI